VGRLDLLVNNAGTFGRSSPIEDYPLETWSETIQTNLTGAFMCAQRAFRQMLRQRPSGGRIINNGSISAQVPRPQAVAYSASKHGMTGLTKALALEGRPHRIACGQIDIGNATTEMTDQLAAGALQPDGSVLAEPTIPAEHVAEAVLYMASLPLEANVLSITVMATQMPFVGRG
jgi:NAD(P)-dependent dehydrogenase (short-subunit alcohol dehydrogenase family)